MITMAITGRSGCGKSTITTYYRSLGIPFSDADLVAREILEPGSPCLQKLSDTFGADLFENGILNRRLLADRAFATKESTLALNNITHPAIVQTIRQRQAAAAACGAPLFLIDGAVIIGSALESVCDRILVVAAPLETSVQRICARDGISPEMAVRRLNAQISEDTLREKADYIIENTGTPDELRAKARMILAQIPGTEIYDI